MDADHKGRISLGCRSSSLKVTGWVTLLCTLACSSPDLTSHAAWQEHFKFSLHPSEYSLSLSHTFVFFIPDITRGWGEILHDFFNIYHILGQVFCVINVSQTLHHPLIRISSPHSRGCWDRCSFFLFTFPLSPFVLHFSLHLSLSQKCERVI